MDWSLTDRELELFAEITESEQTQENKKKKEEDPAFVADSSNPAGAVGMSYSYASAVGREAASSNASSPSGTDTSGSSQSSRGRSERIDNDSGGNSSGSMSSGSDNGGKQQSIGRGTRQRRGRHRPRRLRPANQTAALTSALQRSGVFDTTEGLTRRQEVLHILEGILCTWSEGLAPIGGSKLSNVGRRGLSRSSSPKVGSAAPEAVAATDTTNADLGPGLPPAPPPKGRVAVICFGSYRLGVHNPNADIDALALAPPHCTRGDFFASLVKMLREDERVSDFHPVPGAYTPVIKFVLRGICIDLVFARLADGAKLLQSSSATATARSIPPTISPREELKLDDADLIGLDEAGVRSLNGVRVAQCLLQLVPDVDAFRLTLRAVKEWAVVHGLYSNVLGFLGGVNWAILVAWVCVRNKDAPASKLLRTFMLTFSRWQWPEPVLLGPVSYEAPPNVTPLPVWNPKDTPRDRAHIMPIVTPCYPSMNSSYNVGQPQLRRLKQEFVLADQLIADIEKEEREWDELFVGKEFFRQHIHFVKVDIIATSEDSFRAWFGLCESRLRILVAAVESDDLGTQCYPFAKCFRRVEEDDAGEEMHIASFFVALRFAEGVEDVDLKPNAEEFLYKINSWEGRKQGMDLMIDCLVQSELPSYVFDDGAVGNTDGLLLGEEDAMSISDLDDEEDDEERKENDSYISPLKKQRPGTPLNMG